MQGQSRNANPKLHYEPRTWGRWALSICWPQLHTYVQICRRYAFMTCAYCVFPYRSRAACIIRINTHIDKHTHIYIYIYLFIYTCKKMGCVSEILCRSPYPHPCYCRFVSCVSGTFTCPTHIISFCIPWPFPFERFCPYPFLCPYLPYVFFLCVSVVFAMRFLCVSRLCGPSVFPVGFLCVSFLFPLRCQCDRRMHIAHTHIYI